MDVRKLKAFLICCEEMNYTRAADRLFISRQALRQTIQSLETEFNTIFFDNSHNRLTLTEAGEVVRNNAEKLTEAYDSMIIEVHATKGQTMQIGISCSLLPFGSPELAEYLDVFDEKNPQLKLSVSRHTSDQAIKKVLSGELTAAILMMMSCDIAGISGDVIRTFPMGLTYSETHRFAKKEQLFMNDLEGENCLVWGSPELFLKPLSDALAESGIHVGIEVVPSAKTAFYLMEHEGRVMIEYGYPKTRQLQIEHSRPFADRTFSWNLTLVRKTDGSDPAIILLKNFLMEKYNVLDKFRNLSTLFSTGTI